MGAKRFARKSFDATPVIELVSHTDGKYRYQRKSEQVCAVHFNIVSVDGFKIK